MTVDGTGRIGRPPTVERRRIALVLGAAVVLAAFAGGPAGAAEPRPLSLEESLRLATERNLRLRSARQEAAELAEEVPKAYKDFFPKFRSEARYFLQTPRPQVVTPAGIIQVPPNPAFPSGIGLPEQNVETVAGQRTDYNLRLRLDQPLFTGFRLTSAYATAQLDEKIGEARVMRAQQEVAEQVKVAYFEALKGDERRQAAEAVVGLREAEIRHTEGLIAGGRATSNALPPLRSGLAAARQEAFEAAEWAEVAVEDLKRLVGLDSWEAVRPASAPEERVLAMGLDEAIRMAQGQRPDLRELSLTTDRAREGIAQARSGYYPRVGLFGVFDKARETILNPRGQFVVGGVEATWTFWEWGRTSHEVTQAELRHERALTDLKDRQGAIAQDVRAAFAAVRVAERGVTTLRAEVEAAQSAAHVADERFRNGVAVIRDVTTARSELARALARYRAAVYDGYLTRARLERMAGVPELPTAPGGPPLAGDTRNVLDSVELASMAPPRDPLDGSSVSLMLPLPPSKEARSLEPPDPQATPGQGATAPEAGLTGPPPGTSGASASDHLRSSPPTQDPASPFLPPPKRLSPRWLDEPAAPAGDGRFKIALAALADREAAEDVARTLDGKGFGPVEISVERGKAADTYRVFLVGLRSRETAARAARDARRELAELNTPQRRSASPGGSKEAAISALVPSRFALQVASFQDAAQARGVVKVLEAQHFGTAVIVPATIGARRWHRVVLAGFATRESARRTARDLQAHLGFSPVLIDWTPEARPPSP